ncbi:hypothetical protein Zmor_020222 [Zophobas morio]|uniref:Uncharacterized protein n=1 Tax=Zophobas morio TaxID=2755281 RepID=A0AA38I6F7_9CUCU|nr:hypothetical protein Zmor_020222 [Zophobas morio]
MSEKEDRLTGEDGIKVEYTTSNFTIHKFNAVISERKIVYQVVKMTDSLLIFINEKDNMQFSTLFLSLMNRYDTQPICTRLFGDFTVEVSKGIASRLAKKLCKAVYVSCNMEEDRTLLTLIEQRMYEEIKENPDMF